MDTDKELAVLHDHHKDSFSLIRDREKQRDRLFLILIGVLGFVLFQLTYAQLASITELSIGGLKVDLAKVPAAVVLSTSWTYLLVLLLRYSQLINAIEKQYHYLHDLEEYISKVFDSPGLYLRESRVYFSIKDEQFRHWVWGFYGFLFPCIMVTSVCWSAVIEFQLEAIPFYHRAYDLIVATVVVFAIVLHRKIDAIEFLKETFKVTPKPQ